ncbi:MAG: ribosome maturation factor RimP [Firmicutes bacterium]|nr:ribosome maturation factor RimP [Bacillota bacterium]
MDDLAGKKHGGNTVAIVTKIAKPIADELGLILWDVRFVKEGASWYLRIFIDKEGGVTINDCEAMSRAVNGPIDEADPISQSYFLEVSSPGIERELSRPEHFEMMKGRDVSVNLYRPAENGDKEVIAELIGLEGDNIVLADLDGVRFEINKKDAVSVKLYDCEDFDDSDSSDNIENFEDDISEEQ